MNFFTEIGAAKLRSFYPDILPTSIWAPTDPYESYMEFWQGISSVLFSSPYYCVLMLAELLELLITVLQMAYSLMQLNFSKANNYLIECLDNVVVGVSLAGLMLCSSCLALTFFMSHSLATLLWPVVKKIAPEFQSFREHLLALNLSIIRCKELLKLFNTYSAVLDDVKNDLDVRRQALLSLNVDQTALLNEWKKIKRKLMVILDENNISIEEKAKVPSVKETTLSELKKYMNYLETNYPAYPSNFSSLSVEQQIQCITLLIDRSITHHEEFMLATELYLKEWSVEINVTRDVQARI